MSKSPFKVGDPVRQVLPAPIEGVVSAITLDPNDGSRLFLVVSPDADGDGQAESRYFTEEQIELANG
jgi:hypothetical protein